MLLFGIIFLLPEELFFSYSFSKILLRMCSLFLLVWQNISPLFLKDVFAVCIVSFHISWLMVIFFHTLYSGFQGFVKK